MLSYRSRKNRLPFGAQARVAEAVGVVPSVVSEVLKGYHRNPEIEALLAGYMVPETTPEQAFGKMPVRLHKMRERRLAKAAA